jgi:hypothetical protein
MKLLQLPNPGEGGRLGNQLFAIASTIGLALRHGYTPRFPAHWKYREFFNIPDEWFGEIVKDKTINEPCYEYFDFLKCYYPESNIVSISGYLQSPKYWAGYEKEIREYLTPKGILPNPINRVAVHIRRGDYVGNQNYAELPMAYYLNAIESVNLLPSFFGDDAEFMKVHFCPDYNYWDEIVDFVGMCSYNYHIVSNSTFSWWAAYLSGGVVIRPDVYFAGELAKRCTTKDFWPDNWFTAETAVKYDLSDVTFVIPVTIDSQDRIDNLKMVIAFLSLHFNTNILIGEVNTKVVPDAIRFEMPQFHRTKVINDLTRMATTPIVFNWDADVLVSPYQIYKAVKMLRQGVDVVYPYDGTFYMIDRKHLPTNLNSLQSLVNCPKIKVGASHHDRSSYGGAVGYNVEAFWRAGGENENLINYGHDDQERWRRFNIVLDVLRVPGALYHINHWRGENSSFRHLHGTFNLKYWKMLEGMNDDQIIEHIKTFTWLK